MKLLIGASKPWSLEQSIAGLFPRANERGERQGSEGIYINLFVSTVARTTTGSAGPKASRARRARAKEAKTAKQRAKTSKAKVTKRQQRRNANYVGKWCGEVSATSETKPTKLAWDAAGGRTVGQVASEWTKESRSRRRKESVKQKGVKEASLTESEESEADPGPSRPEPKKRDVWINQRRLGKEWPSLRVLHHRSLGRTASHHDHTIHPSKRAGCPVPRNARHSAWRRLGEGRTTISHVEKSVSGLPVMKPCVNVQVVRCRINKRGNQRSLESHGRNHRLSHCGCRRGRCSAKRTRRRGSWRREELRSRSIATLNLCEYRLISQLRSSHLMRSVKDTAWIIFRSPHGVRCVWGRVPGTIHTDPCRRKKRPPQWSALDG